MQTFVTRICATSLLGTENGLFIEWLHRMLKGMRDCLQNVEMHAFFNFFACVVTGRISHAILVFNPCYYTLRRQASKRFDFERIRKAFCLCLWWKFTGLHLICVMLYWSIYNKKAWRENRQKPLVSLRNLGRSQLGSRSVKYTKNKPKIIPGFANSALFVVVMENTTNPSPNCFTNYVKKNFFSES